VSASSLSSSDMIIDVFIAEAWEEEEEEEVCDDDDSDDDDCGLD
jgi:hypothetical protein